MISWFDCLHTKPFSKLVCSNRKEFAHKGNIYLLEQSPFLRGDKRLGQLHALKMCPFTSKCFCAVLFKAVRFSVTIDGRGFEFARILF